MKSWGKGILPVAITEEIKESSGGEEEVDRKSFSLDIIFTSDSEINLKSNKNITNKNYISFQDFKGTFFVPDSYSPPDLA